MKRVRLGLLGCGTVGGGFVRLLESERDRIRSRYGLDLRLERVLVRDLEKERPGVDRALLTTSALDVLDADVCLSGRGAGAMPTAAAVLGDVIALHPMRDLT